MKRLEGGVFALATALMICFAVPAYACMAVFDRVIGFPAGSPAAQLSDKAASVEIMRITSRQHVGKGPQEDMTDTYLFRFEPVRALKGPSQGVLHLYGSEAFSTDAMSHHSFGYLDWNDLQIKERGLAKQSAPNWRQRGGFFYLSRYREPSPGYQPTSCDNFYSFVVGRDYLIFRDPDGDLMRGGFRARFTRSGGGSSVVEVNGLSIQRVFGAEDWWLRDVESSIRNQTRRANLR